MCIRDRYYNKPKYALNSNGWHIGLCLSLTSSPKKNRKNFSSCPINLKLISNNLLLLLLLLLYSSHYIIDKKFIIKHTNTILAVSYIVVPFLNCKKLRESGRSDRVKCQPGFVAKAWNFMFGACVLMLFCKIV